MTAPVQDRFASEHLVGVAAEVVRDVARMQTAAERDGVRLLTFTTETEVSFAPPGDLESFTTALAKAVARTASTFNQPSEGRRYRFVIGGHPAPRPQGGSS